MFRKRILWQLYPSYLIIILVLMGGLTFFFSKTFQDFYAAKITSELKTNAKILRKEINKPLRNKNTQKIIDLCNEFAKTANSRITFISPDGSVIVDTDAQADKLENHFNRPEVKLALDSKIGIAKRYSKTLKKNMIYVAIPIIEKGRVTAILRNAIPLTSVDTVLKDVHKQIMLGGILIALFATFLSFVITRKIKKPLEEIEDGIQEFSKGNLKYRLNVSSSKEIWNLADTLNKMAYQLELQIDQIKEQNNEQNAVFSSMTEGVIALDKDRKIIKMNKAAATLLNVNRSTVKGLKIKDIEGNSELHQFIKSSFDNTIQVENIIQLPNNRHIQVKSTVLKNEDEENIGAVVVLNDITKLRKLENIRKDFVANVSHELRTPITSIQGFVETLLEGAINDKEEAIHFLEIIKKHSARLNAIIEDLLSLSRIEQEAETAQITKEQTNIVEVIHTAFQTCQVKAKSKNIELKCFESDPIIISINPSLVEQSLINLIDNAIKYTPGGGKVNVKLTQNLNNTTISVSDNGNGISQEHLGRIFERFYRIDKGRSSKLGGTGLGLSIVKHIAQLHGGNVMVESKINKGSIFSISLPSI